jgi:H+/Cl- antiporter ClcA
MAAIAQAAPQQPPAPQPATPQKTDWAPTAKVSVGVLAGAITMLISVFLTPHWKDWTRQEMTPAIGGAITSILTFVIQYLVPERRWTFGK